MKLAAWALALCALASCGGRDAPVIRPYVDRVYHPGQEWTFAGRPADPNATVIVLRTDDIAGRMVVHLAIHGVRLGPTPATEVAHLPIAREALEASSMVLVNEHVPIPPFQAGYDEWVRANGGVWTLPIAEILTTVEQTLGSSG